MNKIKRRTPEQIIDFVVWYYTRYPRALQDDRCSYMTDDGRRCGHSIFITEEGLKKLLTFGDQISADYVIDELGDAVHRLKYQGHSEAFWSCIQFLHDNKRHWNDKGVTESGLLYAKTLKETDWKKVP